MNNTAFPATPVSAFRTRYYANLRFRDHVADEYWYLALEADEATQRCYRRMVQKNNEEARAAHRFVEVCGEVCASLNYKIEYQNELAAQLESEARELRKSVQRTVDSVAKGAYWELEGTLDEEQIEFLCNQEPTDRLSLLDKNEWVR